MRFTVLSCSSAADPTTNFRSVIFLSKITSLRLLQNTVYMLHTAGRYHGKRFRKAQCPVIERLTNSLVTHGPNSVKKLMGVDIIKHSMGLYLLTDQNPIQVIVDAVINSGPREDPTRIGSGAVRCQAVDKSPLHRVNQAIYLRTTGARESSFRTIKTIAAESEVQCGAFVSGAEESEIQCVANIFPDQQKLEKRNNFPHKVVLEIIKIIRNNGNDLESRLSVGASRLSVYSITEIFEVLNSQRKSGLRFIEWIWNNNPKLHDNVHICSLIIDNLGRLDDYETMFTMLKKFRCKNICLTFEAFGFLPVLVSLNSIKESTQKVVDLLNKIGGSCRSSGICALIEMFSKLDLFEMARFVINITERKESYYRILVRDKCGRGLIEDGHGIIREMRELHLSPSTTMYNYLLGGLYKNGSIDEAFTVLGEMNEIGIPPDAITFEVLILFVCRLSKMDAVHQLLDQMVCRGLEPRPSTHAAIVKTLFSAEKYVEAHEYVVDSCIAYKKSSNMMYSLIASLYREKGDIMSSLRVLVEMMERCLKPNFIVYLKIVKQLKRIGRRKLARDLENRYSKFVTESRGQDIHELIS